jgi:predicted 2-oxoglutarate/Fe(II)-dependent dioxygenase YbiX
MKKLSDFILIENLLDEKACKKIISFSESQKLWQKHTWYDGKSSKYFAKKGDAEYDEYEEFDVFYLNENHDNINNIIYPILIDFCKKYCSIFSFDGSTFVSRIFPIRVNKYDQNTEMKKHFDHIQSLFSPPIKGIPALTILGFLNDDYEGGKFILFDDQEIETKQGDIIIFPSNFMYPHSVNKINKGTRYSFVTWAV